jgi:hypothetical protein
MDDLPARVVASPEGNLVLADGQGNAAGVVYLAAFPGLARRRTGGNHKFDNCPMLGHGSGSSPCHDTKPATKSRFRNESGSIFRRNFTMAADGAKSVATLGILERRGALL